jgi:hypothetical protein
MASPEPIERRLLAGAIGSDDATTLNGSSGVTGVTNLITVVPAAAASEIKKGDRAGAGSFPK